MRHWIACGLVGLLGCGPGRPAAPAVPQAPPPAVPEEGSGAVAKAGPSPKRLALGANHSCAVEDDGRVLCWGNNDAGQLGDGSVKSRSTPVRVAGLAGVVEIVAGEMHTCARTGDARVFCWGANPSGQLGEAIDWIVPKPREVPALRGSKRLAAGGYATCAVTSDRAVMCAGNNNLGQLGVANRDPLRVGRAEFRLVPGLSGVIDISLDREHACAVKASGEVRCWGSNFSGQLGDGTRTSSATPVAVKGLTAAVEVQVVQSATLARDAAGRLYFWGQDRFGTTHRPASHEAHALPEPIGVEALDGTFYHVCMRRSGGAALCWDSLKRQMTELPDLDVVEIAAGMNHACARVAGGEVRCWGRNDAGQLGDGSLTDSTTPVPVAAAVASGPAPARSPYRPAASCDPGKARPAATRTAPTPSGSRGGVCGNGKRDSWPGPCAPCMAPGPCPCATSWEICDGKDLGGKACVDLGYAGGRLGCSNECAFDVSSCSVCMTKECRRSSLTPPEAPARAEMVLAGSGDQLGAVWIGGHDACRQIRFARVRDDLRPGRSVGFGPGDASSPLLLPTGNGWLVVAASGGGTVAVPVDRSGRPGAVVAVAGASLPVLAVAGPPGGPHLVGLRREGRTHFERSMWSLDGILVDDGGRPLGEPFAIFGAQAWGYTQDPVSGVLFEGDFVVAREQRLPGAAHGVALARITTDGRVIARGLPLETRIVSAPRLLVDGETLHLFGSEQNQILRWRLEDGGRAAGDGERLGAHPQRLEAAVMPGIAPVVLLRTASPTQVTSHDTPSLLVARPGEGPIAIARHPVIFATAAAAWKGALVVAFLAGPQARTAPQDLYLARVRP